MVSYKDKIITFPLFNTCYPKNPARNPARFFAKTLIDLTIWKNGHTALPGGFRNNMTFAGIKTMYHFSDTGLNGYWWSSTESESTAAIIRFFAFDNSLLTLSFLKHYGCAVRRIKD